MKGDIKKRANKRGPNKDKRLNVKKEKNTETGRKKVNS